MDALNVARLRVPLVKRRLRWSARQTEDIRRSQKLLLDEAARDAPDVGRVVARQSARHGCCIDAGNMRLAKGTEAGRRRRARTDLVSRAGARAGRGRPALARGHRPEVADAAGEGGVKGTGLHWRQWARIRRQVLDKAGWRCNRCGNGPPLEVHHRDGDRRNNAPANLEPLCRDCHIRHHDPLKDRPHRARLARQNPRTGPPDYRAFVAKALGCVHA